MAMVVVIVVAAAAAVKAAAAVVVMVAVVVAVAAQQQQQQQECCWCCCFSNIWNPSVPFVTIGGIRQRHFLETLLFAISINDVRNGNKRARCIIFTDNIKIFHDVKSLNV
jgi:hypothetical protein